MKCCSIGIGFDVVAENCQVCELNRKPFQIVDATFRKPKAHHRCICSAQKARKRLTDVNPALKILNKYVLLNALAHLPFLSNFQFQIILSWNYMQTSIPLAGHLSIHSESVYITQGPLPFSKLEIIEVGLRTVKMSFL